MMESSCWGRRTPESRRNSSSVRTVLRERFTWAGSGILNKIYQEMEEFLRRREEFRNEWSGVGVAVRFGDGNCVVTVTGFPKG